MGHVCTFRKLFTPSRVKDASSLNKMTPNSSDVLVSSGRNPYVEHRRLVQDVVPFDHDTDKSFPHVMFATPAYGMRGCERPFYESTGVDFSEPCQECSPVYQSFLSPPFLSAQQHLEDNQCHAMLVNSSKYTSRRSPSVGKTPSVFFNSS